MLRFFDTGFGQFDRRNGAGPCCWDRFDLFWVHEGRMQLRLLHRQEEILPAHSGLLIYPDTHFVGVSLAAKSRVSVQHFTVAGRAGQETPLPLRELRGKRQGYQRYRLPRYQRFEADVQRAVELSLPAPTPLLREMRVSLLVLQLCQLAGATAPAGSGRRTGPQWGPLLQWLPQQLARRVQVGQMARVLGWSDSHFSARFREDFGLAPAHYVKRLRLLEGARLLRETDKPVKLIARELGFTDLPNFYRSFRQAIGHTPAGYRAARQLRG